MIQSRIITIGSGPERLHSDPDHPIRVDRIFFQMLPGESAAAGYVFMGVRDGVTPSVGTTPAVVLDPAPDATHPGGNYEDRMSEAAGIRDPILLHEVWVGGTEGDEMLVKYNRIL